MSAIWSNGPTVDDIKREVSERYITQRWHPRLPLQILNYSPKRVHSGEWTKASMVSRGLILDDQWNVVARPLSKFFNLGERHAPPVDFSQPYEVFEKMDGCLGILYWEDHATPAIATRGSFQSWQALAATRLIQGMVPRLELCDFNPSWTYLFEYLHPQNRIVVNYGGQERLVLLAVIENSTGIDVPLDKIRPIPFTQAQSYGAMLPEEMDIDRPNAEGFVVRWDDGTRVKVKHSEYVYLHRLVTQMTPRAIWELLKAGCNPLDMLEDYAPGEFRIWIKDQIEALWDAYEGIQDQCYADMLKRPDTDDRKATALYFKTCKYPAVLFAMLDSKPYEHLIWGLVKPKASDPFRVEV